MTMPRVLGRRAGALKQRAAEGEDRLAATT